MDVNELRRYFHKEWVCRVQESGLHNGCSCGPDDPHDTGWLCGWKYRASFTEETWNALWSRAES